MEYTILFFAGFAGGILNSVAGGGSFITFPALIFVGVPPVSANATNTFASLPGYLSGAYALRSEIRTHKNRLPMIILTSLLGGILGAWLLLQTPEALFREAIPWLLLFATVTFIFGGKLNHHLSHLSFKQKYAPHAGQFLLIILLLAVCVYGGFFNAGLGIIVLSYLVLAGYKDINAMNGLKLLISSSVSITAVIVFIVDDLLAWEQGILVMIGTLSGGYIAAHMSRNLPQKHLRRFVAAASILITAYFFIDIYFLS